ASVDILMGMWNIKSARHGNIEIDPSGALKAYLESVNIARKLIAGNTNDVQAKRDLLESLVKVGSVTSADPVGARAALAEAVSILEKLDGRGELTSNEMNLLAGLRNQLGT